MTIKEFEDRVEEIGMVDSPYLTPAQVAPVLGWTPQYVRIKAREEPGAFPFPVMVRGNRASFPKVDVLKWCRIYLKGLKEAG